jgi:RHS repeat-associated protein
MDFLPFGEQITGGTTTSHKFTGDERDAESGAGGLNGLDHTQFRQYASALGRWTSPDPLGLRAANLSDPQSLNGYGYVRDEPLDFADPWGLYLICIDHETYDQVDFSVDGIYSGSDLTPMGMYCGGAVNRDVPRSGGGAGGGLGRALADGLIPPNLPALAKPLQLKPACTEAQMNTAGRKAFFTIQDSIFDNKFLVFQEGAATAIGGAAIGCVTTIEVGCVEGAVPGAIVGFLGGAFKGGFETIYRNTSALIQAKRQYHQDLAGCYEVAAFQ